MGRASSWRPLPAHWFLVRLLTEYLALSLGELALGLTVAFACQPDGLRSAVQRHFPLYAPAAEAGETGEHLQAARAPALQACALVACRWPRALATLALARQTQMAG